jgi:hypothetical protein
MFSSVRYLTLAYGDHADIYRQASMLLVSLIACAPSNSELVVITTQPDRFAWFGGAVRLEPIGESQLEAWRGRSPFSMRAKLEAIRAYWPDGGAVALVDADVLARQSLASFHERLEAGDAFMHKHEYDFGRSNRRGNRELWDQLRGRAFGGWEVRIGDGMWNSGVLAAPASDRDLFDRMLRFYDALGDAGVRHFATEQLVEGVVLGRTGRLRSAAPWFTHYWGNKAAYAAAIEARLSEARAAGLTVQECAARYRQHPIDLPAEVRLTRGQKIGRWLQARGGRVFRPGR